MKNLLLSRKDTEILGYSEYKGVRSKSTYERDVERQHILTGCIQTQQEMDLEGYHQEATTHTEPCVKK